MAEEAGEENFFLFGLTAEEVANSRLWYSPYWHYQNEPETRKALDLIFSDHFSRNEPGIFEPLRGALLTHGDQFMHLADLTSYLRADGRLCDLYREPEEWTQKVIVNVAGFGQVFERPHDRGIRARYLAREAVSGGIAPPTLAEHLAARSCEGAPACESVSSSEQRAPCASCACVRPPRAPSPCVSWRCGANVFCATRPRRRAPFHSPRKRLAPLVRAEPAVRIEPWRPAAKARQARRS